MTAQTSVFTTLPDIQARSFADNGTAWAFLTQTPITPGHTLISPKRVAATLDELSAQEIQDIFALAIQVKQTLKTVFGSQGFNCAWNEGGNYGQSVPHFHLHIVPRTPGDTGITTYEPREFLYRPGSREASPEAELAAVAIRLRNTTQI